MADQAQSEHEHGTMDVREQEKTFAGFLKLMTWTGVASILVLIFMALANS